MEAFRDGKVSIYGKGTGNFPRNGHMLIAARYIPYPMLVTTESPRTTFFCFANEALSEERSSSNVPSVNRGPLRAFKVHFFSYS